MTREEIQRHIKSCTKGSKSGGGFVTHDMEDHDHGLGTLIEDPTDGGRRIIIGRKEGYILRRKV
ncbi:MAG: hypothetical protein JRE23_17075 [Deltaproteobacteria bacterium]|nr:hypothetical protein [Deltaproteobacteria bacterium]